MSESHHANGAVGPPLAAEAPSAPRAVAVNIAYLTGAQTFANLCILLANLAVIRCYGREAHDGVVLVVAVVGMFMVVADLGMASKAGVRTIARLRATEPARLNEAVPGLVAVQLGFAAFLAAAVIALAGPLHGILPRLDVSALRMAGTWIFTFAIARASLMLFWGFERMRGALLVNPVRELARAAWVPVCWAAGLDVFWVFVGWTGAHLLTCLTAGVAARRLARHTGVRIRPRVAGVAGALRIVAAALPYYVPFLGLFGLPLVIPVAVGLLDKTGGDVSTVQVCLALALLPRLLAVQVGNAVFPRMSALQATEQPDHPATAALLVRSVRLVCLIAVGVLVAYALVGRWVLGTLYEPAYAAAAPALLAMTFAVGLDSVAIQLDQAMMAMKHVRVVGWMELLRYAVLVATLWLLVPHYAVNGAAAALGISAAVALAAKLIIVRRLLHRVGGWALLAFLALSAAVAGGWWALVAARHPS